MLATNLVAPAAKISDGIAKPVTKTDITVLSKKDKLSQVIAADAIMKEAWDMLNQGLANQMLAEATANDLFGRLCSRIILFMINKQKESLESVECKLLSNIKEMFTRELATETGFQVESPGQARSSSASGEQPQQAGPTDIADVSNPVWISKSNGFEEDKYYTEKRTSIVFKPISLSDRGAIFEEHFLGPTDRLKRKVSFDDLAKDWVLFKGKLHEQVTADIAPYMSLKHHTLIRDLGRSEVFCALMELANLHCQMESTQVNYFANPTEIRTKCAIKKNELTLIPVTEWAKILPKATSATPVKVTGGSAPWFLEAPPKAKGTSVEMWRKDAVFHAYWFVGTTNDENEANVKASVTKIGKYSFPIFCNHKDMRPFDKILVYVKPEPATKKQRV